MRRREFLKNTIYLPGAGITVAYLVMTGCSSDDGSPASGSTLGTQPPGTCASTDTTVDLHFHSMEQPNFSAVSDQILSMTVSHTHTVTLTAADLDVLSTCGSVTKTSTTSASGFVHSHQVTFTGV